MVSGIANIIIFIAAPGAGKGSLSQLCVERLDWQQFSTGNACRKHIAEGTEIGKKIDFAIKSGKLVSDDLIVDMVRDWFERLGKTESQTTIILDGFPRTISQAQELQNMLRREYPDTQVKIVRLVVPDDEVEKRISSRLTCSNKGCQEVFSTNVASGMVPRNDKKCDKCSSPLIRRPDDQSDAIKERLKNYHASETVLLNFYRSVGVSTIELDANRSLEDIFNDLKFNVGMQ